MKFNTSVNNSLLKTGLIVLLIILFVSTVSAATFPGKPSKQHYYIDNVGFITETAGAWIDQKAASLLKEEQIPLYVVTIPSLASYEAADLSIESYASQLFDRWGIGWQDRNYGILLLVSKGDRKARIELGADWEHRHDAQARQIMDELIVPNFKKGDFSTGIMEGVRGLDSMARGKKLPERTRPWWSLPLSLILFVMFVLMVINLFKKGRHGWAWALIALFFGLLWFLARNSGSRGGFGGGSSGGGGATGSW